MSEEEYEEKAARITKVNEEYLGQLTNFLILERKMGKIRAHQHAERLRFFGDDYLMNYDLEDLVEGTSAFPSFVGDWFIRKCMWSDVPSVKENVESFRLWLEFLDETKKLPADEIASLRQSLDEDLEKWCLRARCYNDPGWEVEDLFDEFGSWDDEALRQRSGSPEGPRVVPGTGKLVLNLLLSTKVSRFVGIKPPQLLKLSEWGDWESPEHRWFSNWRCEECFGFEGSPGKVIMVTNEVTRYSVLIRIAGKDPKAFLVAVHSAVMRAFDEQQVARPERIELAVQTLSGSARSVTAFQNQQMYAIDHIVERPEVKYLEDAEKPLNRVPTRRGESIWPDRVFAERCREEPPFDGGGDPSNIVPFLN